MRERLCKAVFRWCKTERGALHPWYARALYATLFPLRTEQQREYFRNVCMKVREHICHGCYRTVYGCEYAGHTFCDLANGMGLPR